LLRGNIKAADVSNLDRIMHNRVSIFDQTATAGLDINYNMGTPGAAGRLLNLALPISLPTGFCDQRSLSSTRYNQWRKKRRFAIEQHVRYWCVKGSRPLAFGVGKTTEISSQEVYFTTQSSLTPGESMRVAVDWPAVLDGMCRITLEICGPVVRSAAGTAVIAIARYEFRTRRERRTAI
jgi:hypothetical protein